MNPREDLPTDRTPIDDPLTERLVAYLDGELSAADSEAIESQLASDPAARERLQNFDRVWNALDALPRRSAAPSFTQSTVAMVAAEASRSAPGAVSPPRRRGWVTPVAMAVAALLAGFVVTRVASQSMDRFLLADLPVIAHLPALDEAGSIGFLQSLQENEPELVGVFTDEAMRERAEQWSTIDAAPPPERRAWVVGLTPERNAELSARAAAFRASMPERRSALRGLNAAITASPDADALRLTALAYDAMVSGLPAGERAELRGLAPGERLAAVQKQSSRWADEASLRLTDEDRRYLWQAIEWLGESAAVQEWIDEQERVIPAARRDDLREHPERLVALAARAATARGDDLRRFADWLNLVGARRRDGPYDARTLMLDALEALREAWPDWSEALAPALPEQVQTRLLETRDDRRRAAMWKQLIEDAAPRDASTYVADLGNDELARLLALPTGDMRAELNRLMTEDYIGWDRRWETLEGPRGFRSAPGRRGGPSPIGPPPRGGR